MTTAAAAGDDPYVLPFPAPGSLVVLPQWIRPGNTHPNSRYQDMIWQLGPLIDNPSTSLHTLRWKNCPSVFRAEIKLLIWTMINGQLRPTYLRQRASAARGRPAATGVQGAYFEWLRLTRWLDQRGISSLTDCTSEVWKAYIAERVETISSRSGAEGVCARLTDLWEYDQISARPTRMSRPPWDTEGIDDYLPALDNGDGAENTTEPLTPEVLGPLLVWAIRFVDDFADDIMAAWAENRRLTGLANANIPSPDGKAALERFLMPLIRSGAPLPAISIIGTTTLARTYVAAVTGATFRQVELFRDSHDLGILTAQRPGPCPMQTPVAGTIAGRPWRERMDFNEAPTLMRHLGTAAMIIILYLTGMRPQEVQGLRSGCCPDPEPAADGGPGRHLIRGRHYKNVADEDGNHVSAGEEREVPWVAIAPVVSAIRVLERMIPEGELLFSAAHHDVRVHRSRHGALKNQSLNKRIEDFVAWASREAEAQNLPEQAIPPDPHGGIGMSRFRRTLAWHIARRPGGLIALAIQYGHMRTLLDTRASSGYGSRARRGIHSVLDVETALAAADTAARLRDRVAAGEKVSGPAARRALTAAVHTPRFEGRIVPRTFSRKAADFLARDGVVLYDNPEAFLICAFKNDNALCEPGPGATAPRQYDCRPGCGNTVRTDSHARQLRRRAEELDELAARAPGPIGKQLRASSARLRTIADSHDETATPAEALT